MLFVVMAVIAIAGVSVARYVQTSWIGRGLRAIRDSEEAAECSGVPTLKLKLFACTVSGALMGAAGAPMPMYLSFIEPASSFSLNYSVSALAMPMIGGTAHWLGPVIGALLLASIQQIVTVTISNEINVLVGGVLLVPCVVAAKAHAPSSALSQVELRKLELARAMAARPKLLISDEAMAGLSGAEVEEMLKILFALNEAGITIIMIEHIMQAVMRFSQRVVCLDAGRIICEGPPASIVQNPDVQKAYLGA